MNNNNDNKFGTVEAVKRIGVSAERLRYWERAGIVRPRYVKCGTRRFRRFSQEDVNRAILIKKFVDEEKYSLEGARKKLEKENTANTDGKPRRPMRPPFGALKTPPRQTNPFRRIRRLVMVLQTGKRVGQSPGWEPAWLRRSS